MSLVRLIIWSSLIGGWAAFLGWLVLEIAVGRWVAQYDIVAILMASLVAVPIGGGICAASGLTNFNLTNIVKRLGLGCAGGLLGGLLGVLAGSCIFGAFEFLGVGALAVIGRILGWSLIGIGIGVGIGASEGIVERSFKKMRNGLIGGVLGGFVGGASFVPITYVASPMSSRALSFVFLGLFIGLFIGLAQVILKQAWLTVEGGFRPGRQMILGQDLITMGTSEKSSLIFIAYGAKGVEPVHLKISKAPEGGYLLEDNQSRTGTLLNGQPVQGATPLRDGDAIQFGVNVVRFNERVKQGDRLPPPVLKDTPKAAIPAEAITAKPPALPPSSAVKAASAPASSAVKPAAAPKAPLPVAPKPVAAAPKPAPPKPQEARCPICDRAIVGIPGERRCGKCFTTF